MEWRRISVQVELVMPHVAKGPLACTREREPRGFFLGRIPQVGESLERETGLVGRMDMEAWVSGFNGYAKE